MRTVCFLSMIIPLCVSLSAQATFGDRFNGKQLRMDFALSGNAEKQSAALLQLREEPLWGGPRENLIDPFEYGGYMLKIYDKASRELIYSRGFNTLFEEWRTTEQAQTETQAWINSMVMPFPHRTATAVLLARNRSVNEMDTLMTLEIEPSSIFIDRSRLKDNPTANIQVHGEPSGKVDLAFVAEGYIASEKDKFFADAKRFTDSLFAIPPYDRRREDFNVRAVFLESGESGTDFSGRGIFKNTALNSGFYTFGTDRYLTTPDMKAIRDAVWNIPCDAVFVLVNSETYGGGGMYNFYAIGTADNERTIQVFVHEFGHSFAGLADEYFSSETSYNDFYNIRFEPWEPNITTLVDFDKKWKDMLPAGTPVPTPAEAPYSGKAGVFEGGGYLAKGIYRPMDHCMMRDLNPFCPVCSMAILQMIDFLTDRKSP
ncbi:MAG: IgA Peptidase M64 [Tannerella sp.]|jgi:hypothetical protein|nr:IgA Peptidase M64 [Tannerella sp.]